MKSTRRDLGAQSKMGLGLLALLGLMSTVTAQEAVETFRNPPEAPPSKNKEFNLTIDVKYATNQIYNPNTKRYDTVYLRSFNGDLVGPTMRVRPGDVLNVVYSNALPPNPKVPYGPDHSIDTPHDFNTGNMHFHGLHVSPAGNSDNVMISVIPGQVFEYEVKIPEDHPAGTFWYHTHRHGSVAIQVASGMAGALIIEGNRSILGKATNGIADIDTILKKPDGTPFPEKIMVLNQTPYICVSPTNIAAINASDPICGANTNNVWDCPKGCVGVLENYDYFGPGDWTNSARYTTINGDVQPLIKLTTGQIERWRVVDSGQRETVIMKLVKYEEQKLKTAAFKAQATSDGPKLAQFIRTLSLRDQKQLLAELGPNPRTVAQWEYAADGLTRDFIVEKSENTVQPGYRSDSLVFANSPGTYLLLDENMPGEGNINRQAEERKILAIIEVTGSEIGGSPREYLVKSLLAATQDLPPDVRDPLQKKLRALDISDYNPLKTVPAEDVTGIQALQFNIDISTSPPTFEINGQPYAPNRVDRLLKLNDVDEWYLTATAIAGHPYHIHVNPFQIVQVITPNGLDAFTTTNLNDNPLYSQYKDMKGLWRDTVFVGPQYRVVMRTRYEKYIGEFVLHCHILDHEDQGMMQNVKIIP